MNVYKNIENVYLKIDIYEGLKTKAKDAREDTCREI